MKKFLSLCLCGLPLLLSACEGGMREAIGLTREAPDEFAVVSRPPLSVPPEFSLRPPREGQAPRGQTADETARNVLIGKPAENAATTELVEPTVETAVIPVQRDEVLSGGGASLLKRAGADAAQENIREQLSTGAVTPVDTGAAKTLMDQLIGQDKAEPMVDAAKEAERLRANKDAGKPLTEGEVPEEKTATPSLIDRIF
jgi:Protein of unknown function (DUF3035)